MASTDLTSPGVFSPAGDGQWYIITQDTSTTGSIDVDYVWRTWVGGTSATTVSYESPANATYRMSPPRPTRAQLEARAQREQEAFRRRDEQIKQQAEAKKRATVLLLSLLTDAERKRHSRSGKIIITGSNGRLYEVATDDYQGNVYELDGNHRRVAGYCCHPRMRDHQERRLPIEDAWAAQVLAIKVHVEEFLYVANITWDRRPGEVQNEENRSRHEWRGGRARLNQIIAA